jgi:hypothetical protein
VATDHFQNHPKWDPAITAIAKTSPGPNGVGTTARLVRTDRGRRVEGSMEVTEYVPVSSSTVVSRFGPFTLRARTTFAPVAPASTRLQLVIDTHARGVIWASSRRLHRTTAASARRPRWACAGRFPGGAAYRVATSRDMARLGRVGTLRRSRTRPATAQAPVRVRRLDTHGLQRRQVIHSELRWPGTRSLDLSHVERNSR